MALFSPGMPKVPGSGRTKGTLNKLTMSAPERIAQLGVDPFLELNKIASTTKDELVKVRVYSIMCEYIYPKRRSVEHTGSVNVSGQVDVRAAIMAAFAKLPEDSRALIAQEMLQLENGVNGHSG